MTFSKRSLIIEIRLILLFWGELYPKELYPKEL